MMFFRILRQLLPNQQDQCPVCEASIEFVARYPKYICRECKERTLSVDGRPLKFGNIDLSGGFWAKYADTDEPYEGNRCFVDGVECEANEARFGGIVVQVYPRPRFID